MEVFCEHGQKFLIVILDNSLPTLDFCAYIRKSLIETWKVLCTCAEIPNSGFG